MKIRCAHRAGEGTGPIRLVQVDEHSVNDILGVLIECLSFCRRSTLGLKVSEDREVSRQIVSVANSFARLDADSRTLLRRFEVPDISIEARQINHGLPFSPIEVVRLRNLTRLLKRIHCTLAISRLKREFSEAQKDHGFMAALLICSRDNQSPI